MELVKVTFDFARVTPKRRDIRGHRLKIVMFPLSQRAQSYEVTDEGMITSRLWNGTLEDLVNELKKELDD